MSLLIKIWWIKKKFKLTFIPGVDRLDFETLFSTICYEKTTKLNLRQKKYFHKWFRYWTDIFNLSEFFYYFCCWVVFFLRELPVSDDLHQGRLSFLTCAP